MSKRYIGCNAFKNIERTKKYACDWNVEWWGTFFGHQHKILDNYIIGYWPLQCPFTCNIGVGSMVSTIHHRSLENIELNDLVHPQ